MTYIKEIITICFLGISSLLDIKRREIPLTLTGIYGVCGLIMSIAEKRNLYDYMIPLAFGVILIAISLLTKGDIGMGDGLILLAQGCMVSTNNYVKAVLLGLILAACWSLILLMIFRKDKKTEIPLIPFLLLGYVGGFVL